MRRTSGSCNFGGGGKEQTAKNYEVLITAP
jgi:hypothetical protein